MAGTADTEKPMVGVLDSMKRVVATVERLYEAARPDAVFAAPVAAEGRTVIAAAEVLVGVGLGGGGAVSPPDSQPDAGSPPVHNAEGIGAGGGGLAYSRPVAVIIIDQDGVRVEPVVDATRLGLAALTVFGSFLFMIGRMTRMSGRMR